VTKFYAHFILPNEETSKRGQMAQKKQRTMTSKATPSKSEKVLLTLFYSIQSQNCSPYLAKVMKTTYLN